MKILSKLRIQKYSRKSKLHQIGKSFFKKMKPKQYGLKLIRERAILDLKNSNLKDSDKKLFNLELRDIHDNYNSALDKLRISETFFWKERLKLKRLSWIMIFFVSLMTLYFSLVIILPFFGVNQILDNVKYFGWPIYSLLFLAIWVPSLFLVFGVFRKNNFSDLQLILEKRSLRKMAIILIIPTIGISIFYLICTKKFVRTSSYNKYATQHKNKTRKILWLSDKKPIQTAESISLGFSWLTIIFWSLIIIYPIYQLVKQTFNGNLALKLGPTPTYKFSFKHFTRLFENHEYFAWMRNSLFISIITMLIVVILSAFAAFIYSRYRFKTKKTSLLLVMTLGLMPASAALSAYYVLSVILDLGVGLNGRYLLIFVYSGGATVGNIFILKGYLDNISTELDDAAIIDGCSKIRLFLKIIMPLMKPMLAIAAIGAFAGPFGDFIFPSILFNAPENFTLAQGLQQLAGSDETAFAAGALIIAIPITLVIIFSQRFITKGTTDGGVKG